MQKQKPKAHTHIYASSDKTIVSLGLLLILFALPQARRGRVVVTTVDGHAVLSKLGGGAHIVATAHVVLNLILVLVAGASCAQAASNHAQGVQLQEGRKRLTTNQKDS